MFATLLGFLAVCFPFGIYCLIVARLNHRAHPVMVWGVWDFAGVLFAVITCTRSLVVPSVRLSPPNVDGASACARAPVLKTTETNAVATAKKIGRLRTSARYAGNQKPWQAFF